MTKKEIDFQIYTLNYRASGDFSLLLLDIARSLTKDLDLMSIVDGRKIDHYVGKDVLKKSFERIINLCLDNKKFANFVEESKVAEKEIDLSFSKLKKEKSLNVFKEFIIVLKKLFWCYVIIDFDASSENEKKVREDRAVLKNYERIEQIKNNLREIVNKAALSKNNYLWRALKIISDVLGVSAKELFFYKEKELVDLIDNSKVIPEKEINERKKAFIILGYRGEVYYFFGKEAFKKIGEIRSSDKRQNNEKILRGDVAYRSSENVIGKVVIFRLDFGNLSSQVRDFLDKVNSYKEKIVLVAEVTTPEMTPVFKKVSAIVTDHGGMNTHAAIISREMKIPCIVGTKNATKILKDGDLIEVDTKNGEIKIISS